MRAELIPPLLAYHVVGGGAAPVVPWYLAGGVAAANCITAYKPKGAADYAASKINLAKPGTMDATDGAAYPTWDANGWTFASASSQYLIGGTQPAGVFSIIARVKPGNNTAQQTVASFGTTYRHVLLLNGSTVGDPVTYFYVSTGCAHTSTGYDTTNYFTIAIVANSASSQSVFINGGSKGTGTTSANISNSGTQYIGARNTSSFGVFLDGIVSSIAYYDTNLSDDQVAAITTAMNAL